MANNTRVQRVADQIQKEIAQLIQREMKDPRIGFVTVSSVRVSKDLSYADIFVSVLGKDSAEEAEDSITALKKGAGFLRSQLGRSLNTRQVPQLRFHFDDILIQGHKMNRLIEQANQSIELTPEEGPVSGVAGEPSAPTE